MLTYCFVFVFASPTSGFVSDPPGGQEVSDEAVALEKVIGDSPANYTGPRRSYQLFANSVFQVAPNPPKK
jgi:hypothetical protein